jgi:hypothetical protein
MLLVAVFGRKPGAEQHEDNFRGPMVLIRLRNSGFNTLRRLLLTL